MNVIKRNSPCQRLLEEKTPTINRHAEFISASSRYDNNKTLKQVQGDDRMGFTLIELLVVVLIIGILAAVALPQYQVLVAKNKVFTDWLIAKEILKAQQMYYLANGNYTSDVIQLGIDDFCVPVGGNYEVTYNMCNTKNARVYLGGYGMTMELGKPNGIKIIFQGARGRCQAANTDVNSFLNKVCQKVTGKQTPSGSEGGNSPYAFYYRFN